MRLLKKICVDNYYAASSWNMEIAAKYIFEVDSCLLEASYFEHYHDKTLVKKVIELPTSYGCPMKCGFCASSHIKKIQQLSSSTITEIYKYIFSDADILANDNQVISFTGMGDLFFTIDEVEDAINKIAKSNNKTHFTVSSCCWTSQLLQRVEVMAKTVKFRAIQFSFVSCDPFIVRKVIPFYPLKIYNPKDYYNLIERSPLNSFRINYIMIRNLNDSDADFNEFTKLFSQVRNKVTIRIAKLNETVASNRNNLLSPDIDRMRELKCKLDENGFRSYLFYSAQNDNMNCGQLITECTIGNY